MAVPISIRNWQQLQGYGSIIVNQWRKVDNNIINLTSVSFRGKYKDLFRLTPLIMSENVISEIQRKEHEAILHPNQKPLTINPCLPSKNPHPGFGSSFARSFSASKSFPVGGVIPSFWMKIGT
ncbi:MAG TPA: hypothetical protein VN963_11210, partial [bacterium]|nr:hypothetical protein [bacterium]